MIKNVTIGSDAELFVRLISNDSIVPVCGMIGGTKKKPRPMGTGGYFVQEDNVLLEFNIPPCNNHDAFVRAMMEGVKRARNQLPPAFKATATPSAHLDAAFLSIEQACVFGCEPDLNAWKRVVNPRPHADDPTLRTAAAHVHIGWTNPNIVDQHNLIKAADLFVVLPSLWEDKDEERRKLYGKAGAFRLKEYGVEHRVLSNYWIESRETISTTYMRYFNAINFVNAGFKFDPADEETVITAINTNNKALAEQMMTKYKVQ